MTTQFRPAAPNILCVGMPVRDLVFRVDNVPARGNKMRATHFTAYSGGNALNAAVAISRLGSRVLMSGPMGHSGEKVAEQIFEDLAREGIDGSAMVQMPGLVTPISSIMIDRTGERTIVTYRDPRMWEVTLPDTDELLKDRNALLTESRCGFVRDLCFEAKRRGIPVVLDADRAMPLDEGLLQASTHIVFSAEALHATTGTGDDIAALRTIAALTPAFVGVTNGAGGMTWLEDGKVRHMAAFSVAAVDTLGAGDVFHGAFTVAIAEGQSIEAAMRFSAAAAALKCTRHGGAFGSPQRIEVEAFLAESATPQPA